MAKKKTLWETYSPEQLAEAQAFCEDYKAFMSNCKTERECVTGIIDLAEEKGYRDLKALLANVNICTPAVESSGS